MSKYQCFVKYSVTELAKLYLDVSIFERIKPLLIINKTIIIGAFLAN